MKFKFLFLLSILTIVFNRTIAQKIDSVTCLKMEESLGIIKQFLKNKNSDTSLRRVSAIHFLTVTTRIPSESDGNYIGQLNPTEKDYKKWQKWYFEKCCSIPPAKAKN
ncbi:hypothetical protein [Ferruginibacter sp. SUN106]|uniref:hypothetical protein n=1 Tax=Ferruginibacter sp. SUN106 TaxID=2978348 RepID=UPI003D36DC29